MVVAVMSHGKESEGRPIRVPLPVMLDWFDYFKLSLAVFQRHYGETLGLLLCNRKLEVTNLNSILLVFSK